jgi:predicted secreted hydrolase
MGFQLRQQDGKHYSASTWIDADGATTAYPDGAFTAEPLSQTQVAGREVPTEWQVRLPDRQLDVRIAAMNPRAWMPLSIPYWEGPVTISGSHSGVGYLEMTGYE